jgi:hypothetical protein
MMGRTTLVIVVAVISAVLATPMLMTYRTVLAAPQKVLDALGTGTLTCPNGSVVNVDIFIFAIKDKGRVGGVFDIFDPNTGVTKGFFISQGQINAQRYNLQGNERDDLICGASTPVTASASGLCGINAPGQFTAANGERAQFTANVACSG